MPSSSFIVNSEFQPMSYQELLHPVITQTQYQRELDEKYTQLDLQADKLEQLANSAVDQASYEKYKSFANRLREEASNLARYGLRGRDNARFMELFRSYGKEIQPLLDAQTKRERLIAMQQQLSMQDPTSLYDRSAGNISLEELMANPSAAPVRQSGELLRAQASAMATNLQNELRQATFSKTATPGYLAFTQKYGLSSADVAAFVSNPNSPNASKVLRAIYDQVMTSSGVKENWEGDAYNRASQYVGMGLWNAIGKSAVQPLTDQWALQQDQHAFQASENAKNRAFQARQAALNRRHQRQMAAAQAATAQNIAGGMANVVPTFANQPGKTQKQREEFNKWMGKKYIAKKKDGSYYITDAGMKALFSKGSHTETITSFVHDQMVKQQVQVKDYDSNFYNFMKNTGMIMKGTQKVTKKVNGKDETHVGISRAQVTKNINTWFTANEMGYDMNMKPLVRVPLGSASGLYKDNIAEAISEKELKRAGINRNDILKGNAANVYIGEDGITMPIIKSDGTRVLVNVPKELNPTQYTNAVSGVKQALKNQNDVIYAVENKKVPIQGKDGKTTWRNATDNELRDYVNVSYYGTTNEILPNVVMDWANTVVPVSSKPLKVSTSNTLAPQYDPYQFMEDYLTNTEDYSGY